MHPEDVSFCKVPVIFFLFNRHSSPGGWSCASNMSALSATARNHHLPDGKILRTNFIKKILEAEILFFLLRLRRNDTFLRGEKILRGKKQKKWTVVRAVTNLSLSLVLFPTVVHLDSPAILIVIFRLVTTSYYLTTTDNFHIIDFHPPEKPKCKNAGV